MTLLIECHDDHGGPVCAHEARLRVALVADRPDRPVKQCARLRALATHPAVVLVRVTPLVHQYPLNDKLYYPVYATCAELGLPVSVNVGVPGPRVRSACQHPELLEHVKTTGALPDEAELTAAINEAKAGFSTLAPASQAG